MFNLQHPAGWEALGAAWRVARSNWEAALDVFGERERAAQEEGDAIGAPGDADTHAEQLKRYATLDAVKARHGVPVAEAIVSDTGDTDSGLVDEALGARAPTLAAFMLKLDMVSDAGGWNDFDNETWPLFVADVRRFAMLKATKGKGVQ